MKSMKNTREGMAADHPNFGPEAGAVATPVGAQDRPSQTETLAVTPGLTSLGAQPSVEQYRRSLRDEHLEEVGFLLQHRRHAMRQLGVNWGVLENLEARICLHALLWQACGGRATECRVEQFGSDVPIDERRAYLHMVARLAPADVAAERLAEGILRATTETLPQWCEALQLLTNVKLRPVIIHAMHHGDADQQMLAASLMADRNDTDVGALLPAWHAWVDRPGARREVLARALGRARDDREAAIAALRQGLSATGVPDVHVMLAMLRLGAHDALVRLRQALLEVRVPNPRLYTLLGLAGDLGDVEILIDAFSSQPPSSKARIVHAMGYIGALRAVPVLQRALETWSGHADSRRVTWEALWRITGWRPDRPGDEPPQIKAVGAHTGDVDIEALDERLRHRFGRPFEIVRCLDELSEPQVDPAYRRLCAHELAIRGGQVIAFEPTWGVVEQRHALSAWRKFLTQSTRTGQRLRAAERVAAAAAAARSAGGASAREVRERERERERALAWRRAGARLRARPHVVSGPMPPT